MKHLLLALGLSVALVFVIVTALRSTPGDAARAVDPIAVRPSDAPDNLRELITALAQERSRGDRLELELATLRDDVERLLAGGRQAAAPSAPPLDAPAGERDGLWYLQQFVRSFDGGGTGSEYYRLGVQAHVLELVDPVARHVRSRGANVLLRTQLAAILGDPRLREDRRVLTALFGVLQPGALEMLCGASVEALGKVTTEAQVDDLVSRVFRVDHDGPRAELVRLALEFAGERANRVLADLLRLAPDGGAEIALIAEMRTADIEGGLLCFQIISSREQPTRLSGAHRTHEFRDERTIALVDEWAAREPDEEVRRVLIGAREALSQVPDWSAEQAIGPPDVTNPSADSKNAWATATADGGNEWLELRYASPMRAREVQVHEVCKAGAIARVVLIDEQGERHTVWQGDDPLAAPGVFTASFSPTSYRVRALRLELDTSRAPGWNEIDAVRLIGPDGSAWASEARASSHYGESTNQFELLRSLGYGFGR